MKILQTYDAYHFGACVGLSDRQLQKLIALFNQRTGTETSAVLSGRCSIILNHFNGIGPVVIKRYMRGGFIRHLVKRAHLRLGKTRAQIEFEMMQFVRDIGINAPEPIVYAHHGRIFYQAWLVSRAIKYPLSLAVLSLKDEKKTRQVMASVIEQTKLLIHNDILHVDLHPGNILVDERDEIFLVDFDKGRIHHGGREKLKNRYLTRWRRAVNKHNLPKFLAEMMQSDLK